MKKHFWRSYCAHSLAVFPDEDTKKMDECHERFGGSGRQLQKKGGVLFIERIEMD